LFLGIFNIITVAFAIIYLFICLNLLESYFQNFWVYVWDPWIILLE